MRPESKNSSFERLVHKGVRELRSGRYSDAARLFQKACYQEPNSAQALSLLGSALWLLGRGDDAIARYKKALSINPDMPETLNNLGHAVQCLGHVEEAITHYESALQLLPNYAEAANNLGGALGSLGRHEEAIRAYERALASDPRHAGAHNNLANSLRGLGRHDEALSHYHCALSLKPDLNEARHNLGCVLHALERHDEAVGAFESVLTLVPNHIQARIRLGEALVALSRHQEAIPHYEQAIALSPDDPETYVSAATAYQELGRVADAQGAIERAIALAPKRVSFYLALAVVRKFTVGDSYLAMMEHIAAKGDPLSQEDEMSLHFALGKAYDDVGEFERSFDHLLRGNALKRRQLGYELAHTESIFRKIAHGFTPELIEQRRGWGEPSQIPIFIVGMPRSGTSLVEQIIASHPRVFGGGELAYIQRIAESVFDMKNGDVNFSDIATLSAEDLKGLGRRYIDSIVRSAPQSPEHITDKMPDNFRYLGLIHIIMPQARIIHVRRNPFDTCLSCFSKLFAGDIPYSYDLFELGRYYRAYESLMEHWRRIIPADVLLEVGYEEVVADLEGQARRILAHCGIEWDGACLSFHKTNRPVRTASATQVREPIYQSSIGRWRSYAHLLEPLFDGLGMKSGAGDAGTASSLGGVLIR